MDHAKRQTDKQPAADRSVRLRELFDAATEMNPSQREAYLSEQCADDPSLRREVEGLLQFAEPDDSFLQSPAVVDSLPTPHDSLIGRKLGAYIIRELIAGGGMGSVYLAEQDTPRRTVALKVMTMGLWSDSARRRFSHESLILGRLQHPNIAQVYEAGTATIEYLATDASPDSRAGAPVDAPQVSSPRSQAVAVPFFAMEYVPDALPITVHAERHGCSIDERLRLFLQVCDAVAYGHQRGVIHRDLKPANILVGADAPQGSDPRSQALVKLIDFGVARCTDSDVAATTMHTDAGQLIGTLAYMSPEQCDGDALNIDTRADVYALGVVLYELVCGQLPYDVSKTSIAAAARTICERPPRPLRDAIQSRRRIAGRSARDLEAVILRVLEKDRAKRYQGAADLARDVCRWLNREPIDARPPTVWTKALGWAIRHPVLVTTTVCISIVATIAAATLVSVRQFYLAPYRVKMDGEENAFYAARLVNRMGGTLHEWPENSTPEVAAVGSAVLVDVPRESGGGPLVVVGYAHGGGGQYPGELCAYAIDRDARTPIWHRQIADQDVPQRMLDQNRHGNDCHVGAIIPADVFPEIEGDELVVSHTLGPYSQHVLRVYDLDGKVLYQVWQDGGISSLLWLPEYKRLICFGADEAVKLNAINVLGISIPVAYAVFAVEPRKGVVSNELMVPDRRGGPADAVWYHYIHPLPVGELNYSAWLNGPAGATQGAVAQIVIEFGIQSGEEFGFSIPIDKNGDEILPSAHKRGKAKKDYRVPHDIYPCRAKSGQLPASERFRISADPPGIPAINN